MDVNDAHALIDQFRETFEGTRPNWITDGKPETAVLGLLDSFTEAQSHRPPAPGARTVARRRGGSRPEEPQISRIGTD